MATVETWTDDGEVWVDDSSADVDAAISQQEKDLLEKLQGGPVSPSQTAVDSFTNGALLKYQPQIEGAARSKLIPQFTGAGLPGQAPAPSYVDERDSVAARIAAGKEAHPQVARPAELLGTIAGGAGVGGVIRGAGLAGELASPLARMARGAGVGGTVSALENPGDTPGIVDPIQAGPRAKNFARGAAVGGGIATAAEASAVLRPYFTKMANEKAFKTTGAYKKDFLRNYGNDRVQDIGQQYRDEGLIRPWTTPKRLLKNLQEKGSEAGREYGQFIKNVDEKGIPVANPEQLADKLSGSVSINPYAANTGAVPSAIQNLRGAAGRQATPTVAGGQLTAAQTQAEKKLLDEAINYNRPMPEMKPAQAGLLQIRNSLRDNVRTGVEASGQDVSKFDAAGMRFGNLAEGQQIAEGRIAGEAANRAFGLSDNIQGAAGSVTGGALGYSIGGPLGAKVGAAAGGALGAGINKTARTFGNAVQSNVYGGLEGVSGVASRAGQSAITQGAAGAASSGATAFNRDAVLSRLQGTPWEQKLSNTKNDADFALRYFTLQKTDPQFRKAIQSENE